MDGGGPPIPAQLSDQRGMNPERWPVLRPLLLINGWSGDTVYMQIFTRADALCAGAWVASLDQGPDFILRQLSRQVEVRGVPVHILQSRDAVGQFPDLGACVRRLRPCHHEARAAHADVAHHPIQELDITPEAVALALVRNPERAALRC